MADEDHPQRAGEEEEAIGSNVTTTTTTMAADRPNLFCAIGSETTALTEDDLRQHITSFLNSDAIGPREDILILPPDFTRFHSQAGKVTQLICEHYRFVPPPPPTTTGPETEEPASKRCKTNDEDVAEAAAAAVEKAFLWCQRFRSFRHWGHMHP